MCFLCCRHPRCVDDLARGRVENVLIPSLGSSVSATTVECVGNQERDVEEQFTVIRAVRTGEVELAGVGAVHNASLHDRNRQASFGKSVLSTNVQEGIDTVLEQPPGDVMGERSAKSTEDVATVARCRALHQQDVVADLQQSILS